jgi:hypothetical protein
MNGKQPRVQGWTEVRVLTASSIFVYIRNGYLGLTRLCGGLIACFTFTTLRVFDTTIEKTACFMQSIKQCNLRGFSVAVTGGRDL